MCTFTTEDRGMNLYVVRFKIRLNETERQLSASDRIKLMVHRTQMARSKLFDWLVAQGIASEVQLGAESEATRHGTLPIKISTPAVAKQVAKAPEVDEVIPDNILPLVD